MTEQQELIPIACGEYLRQQRKAQKYSLSEVAKAINLDEKLLRDIEDEIALPIADLYRNGYVQVYAKYLQIPQDKIQQLISACDKNTPKLRTIFPEPKKQNPADQWLRGTSYVLASLLIGTLAWQFSHEAVRLTQRNSAPKGSAQSVQVTDDSLKLLQTPVKASIAPLGVLHSDGTTGQDTAQQAWAAVTTPALATGESRLQISVSADSWVEITDRQGRELVMDLLRGGSEKVYQGTPPFRILLGRASAVRLYLNDELVDLAPHTHDDVAQMTWPLEIQADNSGSDQD